MSSNPRNCSTEASTGVGNTISYLDGCDPQESCDCIPLSNQKVSANTGLTVNQFFDVGDIVTVSVMAAPAWAIAQPEGTGVRVTGTAPQGNHTLVYTITNSCSSACLVVELSASQACVGAPANIVQDLSYKTTDNSVSQDIQIPSGTVVTSPNTPGVYADVLDGFLNFTGTFQEPIPATYSATLKNECGTYTVSGNIVPCIPPQLTQAVGNTVLERNVAGSFGWVVQATGVVSIKQVAGLPAGMAASVQANTPSAGLSTITIAGTPSENPCQSSSCEVVVNIKASCGEMELRRKFTQQPCRTIAVVGETGSKGIEVGVYGEYCKILTGYDPSIVDMEGVPYGMEVTLNPHTVAGQWILCIKGTPKADPCADSEEGVACNCAKIKLKNVCGEKDVEICTTLDVTPKLPYCVGMVDIQQVGTDFKIDIFGVIPNSTATVQVEPNAPIDVPINSSGQGTWTGPLPVASNTVDQCIIVTHPTCFLIRGSKSLKAVCVDALGGP